MFDLSETIRECFTQLLEAILSFLRPASDQVMYAVQTMPDRLVDSLFQKLSELFYDVLNAPHLMGCGLCFFAAFFMMRSKD